MSKIVKQLEGFVSNTYPDFFYASHPKFQAFLDAYFEWLEKDNTEAATNAKDIFKSVPNPGAIINHAPEYRDVDLTLKQFVDYFKKEIMDFNLEDAAVPDSFLIKRIREVYLAKGTLKSFELLFKLLYNEDIEAYETRDFIVEASEGTYQNTVVCYFKIKSGFNDFDNIDFTLSEVLDSENGASKAVVLSITPISYVDSDNKLLFLAQLSVNAGFQPGEKFVIKNKATPDFHIGVEVVPSLSNIKISNAAGFSNTDVVIIKSRSTGRSTTATIETSSGPVTHLLFRNRGYNYRAGDEFVFTVQDPAEGDGASARVTAVDQQGRITAIDGVPVRTGAYNKGILTNNFEEALIPLQTKGNYKKFPKAVIDSKNTTPVAQPYSGSNSAEGYGAQFTTYSLSVGSIDKINTLAAGAYEDSDDVEILAPTFVRLYNADGSISSGNRVVLQQFMPDSDAFLRDSDTVVIDISVSSVQSSGATYRLPYAFDSETWSWKSNDYYVDPTTGFVSIEADWDSDNATILDNELFKVSFTADRMILQMEGPLTWSLDEYHWEQINAFQSGDSELTVTYTVEHGVPRKVEASNTGYWRDTKYRATVYNTNGSDQLYLLPLGNYDYPTTAVIGQLSSPRNTILRLSAISYITGEPIYDNNLALGNILSQWSAPEFKIALSGSWETDKRFIDDSGFLNSPSGGVLQDSAVYSYYTYLIQTLLPVGKWRNIVKHTVHPAGMIMYADLKYTSMVDLAAQFGVSLEYGFSKQTSIFDAAQDVHSSYRAPYNAISQIYAGNREYAVDSPNAFDELNVNGQVLLADHSAAISPTTFTTYNGNAWWDFEPVGHVNEEDINDIGIDQTVLNFDLNSLKRRITTQNQLSDSDYVGYERIYYNRFDGTSQDLYKTHRRIDKGRQGILTTSVPNTFYSTYDSEMPFNSYARFSDSDLKVVKSLNYDRLKGTADGRNFPSTPIKRVFDLQYDYEIDLQKAMKEDGSLSFYNDSDEETYYNFDALEIKWNHYNSTRIAEENGGSQWQIPGWESWLQNRGRNDHGNPRGQSWTTEPKYMPIKTPYRRDVWRVGGDSDNILWTDGYVPPINSRSDTLVEWETALIENNTTYRDPRRSMAGRKGNR